MHRTAFKPLKTQWSKTSWFYCSSNRHWQLKLYTGCLSILSPNVGTLMPKRKNIFFFARSELVSGSCLSQYKNCNRCSLCTGWTILKQCKVNLPQNPLTGLALLFSQGGLLWCSFTFVAHFFLGLNLLYTVICLDITLETADPLTIPFCGLVSLQTESFTVYWTVAN